jgi:hypothetical protein
VPCASCTAVRKSPSGPPTCRATARARLRAARPHRPASGRPPPRWGPRRRRAHAPRTRAGGRGAGSGPGAGPCGRAAAPRRTTVSQETREGRGGTLKRHCAAARPGAGSPPLNGPTAQSPTCSAPREALGSAAAPGTEPPAPRVCRPGLGSADLRLQPLALAVVRHRLMHVVPASRQIGEEAGAGERVARGALRRRAERRAWWERTRRT